MPLPWRVFAVNSALAFTSDQIAQELTIHPARSHRPLAPGGTRYRKVWGRLPIGARAAGVDHRSIARLMLFVSRPYHLSDQEADRWMRSQAAPLADTGQVTHVHLVRLRSASGRGGGHWDWLIEIHCDSVDDAARAARTDFVSDLVGDLRLLGMRPMLVLAEPAGPLER